MSTAVSFVDLDTMKPNMKGSFIEKLLPLRKGLFEKFPVASKGLAISGPGIKFGDAQGDVGNGHFSFTANEKSEKVEFTGNKKEGYHVAARFKRDANQFDVALRGKCNDTNNYLIKYEERQQKSPTYVLGWDMTHKSTGAKSVIKVDPLTTRVKHSISLPGGNYGIPKDMRFAADYKLFMNDLSSGKGILYNVGVGYDTPVGQVGIALNQKHEVTLTHIKRVDKVQVGVELAHNVEQLMKGKSPSVPPFVVAASYDVDPSLTVRGKINHNMEVSLGVKKDFNKHVNISLGTAVQARNLQDVLMRPPAFGFKMTLKQ